MACDGCGADVVPYLVGQILGNFALEREVLLDIPVHGLRRKLLHWASLYSVNPTCRYGASASNSLISPIDGIQVGFASLAVFKGRSDLELAVCLVASRKPHRHR